MERDLSKFRNLSPEEATFAAADAYVMGAVDNSVIVDFDKVVEGAQRETGVPEIVAVGSIWRLANLKRLEFDYAKGKLGKHGIPERAERSTKSQSEQKYDAANLYHAMVENGDEFDIPEAIDHAIFSTGANWKVAAGALAMAANDDVINKTWDGRISKFQTDPEIE